MFSYDANNVYHRGPYLWVNYLVWAAYYLTMIGLVIKQKNVLGMNTTGILLLFFAFELGLQIYQFFVVDFYIGGIAFAGGILFLVIAPVFLASGRDHLTGLYNRQGFINVVKETLRINPNDEYYMVALDINNFSNVNERFGFSVGNEVLKYMGDYLNKVFPNTEAIGRFNADHFFAFCTKSDLVYSLPNIKIKEVLNDINEKYSMSVFEGIYPVSDKKEDVLHMCDRAVFAVNTIKGDYNEQYAFFDNVAQERLQLNLYLQHEMTNAIKEKKFAVYYQPVVDIKTNKIVRAEALIRWNDDKYGIIAPGIFIPLFEKNRSISVLDLYMCKEVCDAINQWKKDGINCVPVSVNISRIDILSENFTSDFIEVVEKNNISSEEISVELTESAFAKLEEIKENLNQLHDKGFHVLMDDFGSAYSTFNVFATIPFDILKVDMGFMDTLDDAERGHDVFESIVDMSNKIKMPIIVEGVETLEQVEVLNKTGIQYVQGFVFAKPMPKEEFTKLLKGDYSNKEYLGAAYKS